MEIKILDLIQSIRTPVGDMLMCFITKLGNAGIIWILLAVILLMIPKTRKSGIILAVALCVDLVLCNGILKNLFVRIRPCDVNTSIQLLIPRPMIILSHRVIQPPLLQQWQRFIWRARKKYGRQYW